MLAHRLRRWPNIVPTLAKRLLFAGNTDVNPMLIYCWATVGGGKPPFNQRLHR